MTIAEFEQSDVFKMVSEQRDTLLARFPASDIICAYTMVVAKYITVMAETNIAHSMSKGLPYELVMDNPQDPVKTRDLLQCAKTLLQTTEVFLMIDNLLLNHVPFIPVESSNLKAIGRIENALYVEFHSGAIYRYHNVPNDVYDKLMEAESKGKAFNQLIKNGDYPWAIVRQSSQKPEGL